MLRGESMRLCTLQIENPNQPVLHQERHNQLRTDFHTGLTSNVAGIFAHVMDAQGASLACGRSGKALMESEPHARGNGIIAAHAEDALQQLRLFIPEHDAEDVIVNDFLDALGNPLEELLPVKDRGQFAAHLVQKRQGLRLFRIGDKQTLRNRVRITQHGKRSEV